MSIEERLREAHRRVVRTQGVAVGLFLIEVGIVIAMWIISGQLRFWVRP